MTPLTLAELRLTQARLAHKAERLRQEWRAAPSIGSRALSLGKQVKATQERADDYARLIKLAEAEES